MAIAQPPNGTYRLVVTSDSPNHYRLAIRSASSDGTLQPALLLNGFSGPALPSILEISFNKAPGSMLTATQVLCNPGGPYTAECGGALTTVRLDGTRSADPNGSPLTFLWASDCPGAIFDNPASPTPTLILNSGSVPETCNVTLTASNAFGLSSSCSATVTVKDTTPPGLTCPTGLVVEFVNETGAPATFSATATDLCSAVTITYTPPSGSLFPIGVTPVQVQAMDVSSNIAQCTFDVTVLGARGVKSNILAELVALRATATTRVDCWELDEAIEDMIDALGLDVPGAPRWVQDAHRAPNCRGHHHHPRVPLWLDETHVNPDAAWWVFSSEKDAVKELVAVGAPAL